MDKKKMKEYVKKRDFNKTPEPDQNENADFDQQIFVIQKHNASNLHYDFRLEVNDVLKSWAIPKGPSTDPSVKRLAIPTEDHPMAYGDFEGVIPEDEYGGGQVIVWDKGTYENQSSKDDKEISMDQAYQKGHISVWLNGEKLQGGYSLVRTGDEDDSNWLLIKEDDEESDARRKPAKTENKSVMSDKTIDDLKEESS